MKKEYVKPTVACYDINCEAIIALSTQDSVDITNDNKREFDGMYSREDNKPSTPNLWEQGW